MLIVSGCKIPEISTLPDSEGDTYKSVNIRVKVTTQEGKDKTKILLGYTNRGDRLIFLGPMNQALFEIIVSGNRSKIIIPKRKKYWEGEFREFLYHWWKIDLTYNEIKALLLEQRVNRRKLEKNRFLLQIIESEKHKYPVRINLTSPDIKLEFRIYEIKEKKGKLQFQKPLDLYSKVKLEELLRTNPE